MANKKTTFRPKLKPLTKREVKTLKREREFLGAMKASIMEDVAKFKELHKAYQHLASKCPHRHANGRSAWKKDREECDCGETHSHCTICGGHGGEVEEQHQQNMPMSMPMSPAVLAMLFDRLAKSGMLNQLVENGVLPPFPFPPGPGPDMLPESGPKIWPGHPRNN